MTVFSPDIECSPGGELYLCLVRDRASLEEGVACVTLRDGTVCPLVAESLEGVERISKLAQELANKSGLTIRLHRYRWQHSEGEWRPGGSGLEK